MLEVGYPYSIPDFTNLETDEEVLFCSYDEKKEVATCRACATPNNGHVLLQVIMPVAGDLHTNDLIVAERFQLLHFKSS